MVIDCLLGYLDPGSGGMLLQMLIGSVMAVGLFFHQTIARALGLFRRGRRPAESERRESGNG